LPVAGGFVASQRQLGMPPVGYQVTALGTEFNRGDIFGHLDVTDTQVGLPWAGPDCVFRQSRAVDITNKSLPTHEYDLSQRKGRKRDEDDVHGSHPPAPSEARGASLRRGGVGGRGGDSAVRV